VAEKFRSLMRQVEAFSGVQVVTYCIMTNHVHLLLRVPERKVLSDSEMLARLQLLSSPWRVRRVHGPVESHGGAEERSGAG
jgi:REP element-mobilizing transposase RayT